MLATGTRTARTGEMALVKNLAACQKEILKGSSTEQTLLKIVDIAHA